MTGTPRDQQSRAAVRSFVAIDLPSALRDRLGELVARLSSRIPPGTVRWVRPEGIHLTLRFLGELSTGSLTQVRDLLERVSQTHGPFSIRVGGLGCFPTPRRPRVIWVGVEEPSGRLAGLQQALEAQFERIGYRREGREFSPHLTLGRLRDEIGAAAAQAAGASLSFEPTLDLGTVHVASVCLFRSDLRPTGAVYTRLAEIALRGER